jgi:hypothetical protein
MNGPKWEYTSSCRLLRWLVLTGRHTITLTGNDTSDKESTDSIIVNISHFSDQSYFPLPQEGIWVYRHTPSELAVTNSRGETEHWTLENMTVSSDDINTRICRMDWTVENNGVEMSCHYTLTDQLALDGNRFLVTATDEVLTVFDENDPIEELVIETAYTPFYPLLTDYFDPNANNREEATVTAESALKYTITGVGTQTKSETGTITVSYETGSPEEVTTGQGSFAAIPLYSRYNNTERTWWLSQGVGIVQMVYGLSGQMLEASLIETNMDSFSGEGNIPKITAGSRPADTIHVTLDAMDEAGRLHGLRGMMKSMCPR